MNEETTTDFNSEFILISQNENYKKIHRKDLISHFDFIKTLVEKTSKSMTNQKLQSVRENSCLEFFEIHVQEKLSCEKCKKINFGLPPLPTFEKCKKNQFRCRCRNYLPFLLAARLWLTLRYRSAGSWGLPVTPINDLNMWHRSCFYKS